LGEVAATADGTHFGHGEHFAPALFASQPHFDGFFEEGEPLDGPIVVGGLHVDVNSAGIEVLLDEGAEVAGFS